MATNYLPFIRRQYFEIAATSRDYARLPMFSIGGGKGVILGDFSVLQSRNTLGSPMLMRIGVSGYKYFTEEFQKVGTYLNGTLPLYPCWVFPRPYRLYPGQRLRAQVPKWLSPDHYGGIVFNGKREKDNKPIMLYDSDESSTAAGTSATLNDETLACPHDSSVLLYSMAIPDYTYAASLNTAVPVQVWGPDDRQWVDIGIYGGVAAPATINQRLLAPPGNVMELGEKNGWVLDHKQTFTAEFINQSASTVGVTLTLRGVIEVEE